MQAKIKTPIPTQRRVLKDGKGMLNELFISTGKLVATDKDQKSLHPQGKFVISTWKLVATEYQGCSENPAIPEYSEDSEPQKVDFDHIISEYQQTVYLTWRKSSRSQEGVMNGNRWMI